MQDGLAAWHAKAAGNCAIDYGFHQIIGGVDEDALAAMPGLIDEGITSFKLFMAYPGVFYSDDAQVLKAMQVSRETGLLTMMHAENGPVIDVLAAQLIEEGKTDPYFHGIARAWQMEEEATHRAIMIANLTGAPLYVVHVSAKQAVEQLAAARDKGQNVFGETCPQYLYLSLEEQLGASSEEWGRFEGAKWVCSTPLRSRAEGHQDHMWQALRTNDLQMVSTDHCPFCMKDQKELGRGDFRAIPNGIGSIEHRMDLMYQGVVTGKITLERWVELTSTTPARMFGLYGRKGVIQPGADADIVVYDPNGHTSIGVGKTHHMNMDHSAWEGFEIDGHVDTVLSRGQGRRRRRRVPRRQGRRPLPQARPQPVPDVRITMDFGVVLQTNPPAARTVQLAKLAEAHGFSHVWTFDSHLLWQEPYVIHSAILAETKRVKVGPFVTNPATRDWTVTASVFATLNEMYGNRTICGIGRGDSAVRVTNGKPVTMRRAARVDPRDPRARELPAGRVQRRDAAVPVEPRLRARGVGRRLRPARAQAHRRGGRRLHPAARRRRHRGVDDQDGAGCRRRTSAATPTRSRSASPLRCTSATDWRAHARPVPVVRRNGRQPRRRHRREVRPPRRRCPRR